MLIHDVARGDTVTSSDVAQLNVRVDQAIVAVPWEHLDDVVGRKMVFSAKQGTMLTASMFSDVVKLPAGQVVVGAVLSPGALPVAGLKTGDRVDVLVTPAGSDLVGSVVVSGAEIFEIRFLSSDPSGDGAVGVQSVERWVSLLVPADSAVAVETAAHNNELRLAARGA
jgi:hypothetical protein